MKISKFKTTLTITAILCGAAYGSYAANKKLFPAENLFPFLKTYYAIASNERNAFHLNYYAVSKKGPLPNMKLTLKSKSGDVPITLNAKGEMRPLPTSTDLASKAQIELEADKGTSFGIMVRIVANAPSSASLDARNIDMSINQARNGAKKAAGLIGFAMPKLDSACFIGANSGSVILENGQKIQLKAAKSKDDLDLNGSPCYTPAAQKGAVKIILDKAPSIIDIGEQPK